MLAHCMCTHSTANLVKDQRPFFAKTCKTLFLECGEEIKNIFRKVITIKNFAIFRAFSLFYLLFFPVIFNQVIKHTDIYAKLLLKLSLINNNFTIPLPLAINTFFILVKLKILLSATLVLNSIIINPIMDCKCLGYFLCGNKNVFYPNSIQEILLWIAYFSMHFISVDLYVQISERSLKFAQKGIVEKSEDYIQKDDIRSSIFFEELIILDLLSYEHKTHNLLAMAIQNQSANFLKHCIQNNLYYAVDLCVERLGNTQLDKKMKPIVQMLLTKPSNISSIPLMLQFLIFAYDTPEARMREMAHVMKSFTDEELLELCLKGGIFPK